MTLQTYPQSFKRRKRRLNDSVSYCDVMYDNHQNRYNSSSLTKNNSSSSSLFQLSLKTVPTESCNLELSTQQTIQSSLKSKLDDYQSYIQQFPDYRLGKKCSYRYLKNIDIQKCSLNKGQSQLETSIDFSQKQQHFDYTNLCILFQDRYFSVQLIDSVSLQENCLQFIQSYQLSLPANIQFHSNFNSKEEEQSNNQTFQSQNNINFQVSKSKSLINMQDNMIQSQRAKLQINQQSSKSLKLLKRKQEVLCEKENTKSKKINSGYQILVKNIQYETIKEITNIQKIEFSKRTISKVINKFILFLRGDYRSLKYYDLDQKCQNGAAQKLSRSLVTQLSNEEQNTQVRHLKQNSYFELPKFNLFELLDEQDQKEKLQADSNQVNKGGINCIRNQHNSLASNSSQGQCDKIINQLEKDSSQSQQFNQRQSLSQSTPIYPIQAKSKDSDAIKLKQNEEQYNSPGALHEQHDSCSISNSPKMNLNKIKYIQPQRKQSESSFCAEVQLNSNNDSRTQIKQKQTLFNLSKYLMHLILEFLSEEHLDGLQIIPGFQSLIQSVVKRIKKKGQRTEHSQTYYYNHSHYNCLFLLLSDNNLEYVENQKELMELHQYVYEITDFAQPYDLTQLNFIKAIIARLITKQFKIIRQLIDQQQQTYPAKFQTYNNYMITKLQYFERVYQGIKNLKKGQILVRF